MGLEEGAHTVLELAEGEGFGPHNPDMMQWVARSLLDELGDPREQYQVGEVLQFPTPDGLDQYAGTLLQVEPSRLLFDFNHPLAGQAVQFEVKLIAVM